MAASHSKVNLLKIGISIFLGIFVIFGSSVAIIGADIVHNQIRDLIGIGGTTHSLGTFLTNDGNTGNIYFGTDPTDGYSGAHLFVPETGPQILTGSFWMETVGWINLNDVELHLGDTTSTIWSLSGYAWSEHAGWIDFSGATYHLSNTSFSGYAWNDGIGWINMAGASLDMTSSGAIGKVKVLGNLGGNRIYNTIYNLDGKISPATTTKIINEVRKNISLVTRNLGDNINTALISDNVFDNADIVSVGNKLVFENTSSTVARVDYTSNIQSRMENVSLLEPIYSVIAIGADIYIDNSVYPEGDGKPRVMIALKNEAGVGGNIYIDGGVTQIKSSLIAEGSLYSGEFAGATKTLYNNDATRLFKIPNRQLYIYGTLISNNTIGGYGIDNNTANSCPYNITPCTNDIALLYDYNHFRDFQKNLPDGQKAPLRGYKNDSLDAYSLVIEYDPRILSIPPPGLERIQ